MKVKNIIYFSILLSLSCFFYLKNLDSWYLWQDEANFTLLAKNILNFGYPYVFDGKNVIWPGISDVSPKYLYWILWGWLPLYLNAFILFFQVNTFTARLASALTAVIMVLIIFRSSKKYFDSIRTAFLYSLSILFSLPLTLFVRQSGYYVYTVFFSFMIFYFHFLFQGEEKKRNIGFLLFSLALLNTHLLIWGIVLTAIAIISMFQKQFVKYLKLSIVNLVISMPFLYLYQFWLLFERSQSQHNNFGQLFLKRLQTYLWQLHLTVFPWWGVLILIMVFIGFHKYYSLKDKKLVKYVFLFSVISILLTCLLSRYVFLRYIIFLIPLILLSMVIIIKNTFKGSKIVAVLVGSIIFTYHFLAFRQFDDKSFGSLQKEFFYELFHDAEDINEVLSKYLIQNSQSSDIVVCNYGEFPLMFYTDLQIRGGCLGLGIVDSKISKLFSISKVVLPDWVIIRKAWNSYNSQQKLQDLLSGRYEKIIVNANDFPWGNRPSLIWHFFRTEKVKNPLVIYKLIK